MFRGAGRPLIALSLVIALGVTVWGGIRVLSQANRIVDAERRVVQSVARLELEDFARAREAVRGLAEHPRIVEQLERRAMSSELVAEILLQARLSAVAAIVYVIDRNGVVQACSAKSGESLVGHNYAFRPYFQVAMTGKSTVYGAVGITTQRRGFYFATPIGERSRPLGVAVAKLDVELIEQALSGLSEPTLVETAEHVVFATNRPDWLYRSTLSLSASEQAQLLASRQFADHRLLALPFDLREHQVSLDGGDHSVVRVAFTTAPGFSFVLFDPVRGYPLSTSQRKVVVGGALLVSLLGGLVVALLSALHRRDIVTMQLAESEENLIGTLSGLTDAVIATNRNGVVTYVNAKASTVTGLRPDVAIGLPLAELISSPRSPQSHDESPFGDNPPYRESKLMVAGGEAHRLVEHVIPLRNRNQSQVGTVHVFRDVSEQARLLEQLQQAKKLEAVGRLAGGVAHDFNNLLAAISGNAELACLRLGEHRITPYLRDIVSAAGRATELTRQLLTFSRKAPLRREPLVAHAVIREALSFFSRGLNTGVRVVTELEAPRSVLMGDSTQLQSAFLNLLINARDAMPRGGRIRVATRNCENPAPVAPGGDAASGIEILFEDGGVGIPESIKSRIFEPFFTTKDEGRGTGLGLAAVYGCIQGHLGHIAVESTVGEGTTFRIWLPVSEVSQLTSERAVSKPTLAGGHIVVADDDPAVRAFTEEALRLVGYEVSAVGSGADALVRCKELGRSIRACVFDVNMPGPAGAELLQAVRAIHPTVPVLFMSGYTESQVLALGNGPLQAFIAKPFRLNELADVLEQLTIPRPDTGRPFTDLP